MVDAAAGASVLARCTVQLQPTSGLALWWRAPRLNDGWGSDTGMRAARVDRMGLLCRERILECPGLSGGTFFVRVERSLHRVLFIMLDAKGVVALWVTEQGGLSSDAVEHTVPHTSDFCITRP